MQKADIGQTLKGLTQNEVEIRQRQYGENALKKGKKISPIGIFFSQFSDFITIVLLVATTISAFLGEIMDAIVIAIIVVVNGILGFVQEYRTEKSLEALKELSAPMAKVIRNDKEMVIPASQLVPGDLIVIETGDKISADCYLISGFNIEVDESILTGESVPVAKTAHKHNVNNENDTLYMGTIITSGRGRGIVSSIGMSTEMGKIAHMLQSVKPDESPLKKKLNRVGRDLVLICLSVCVVIVFAGMYHGESLYNMFFSGVSLAVAAIPEGLPAIVTLSLAIGVGRMLKKRALVRKLPAVETLGSTTVICSDKTGTLTENNMAVTKIYVSDCEIDVGDDFEINDRPILPKIMPQLRCLLEIGALCNNAYYKKGNYFGEPTEKAILAASYKGNIIGENFDRINEIPFDSDRKCMSVICENKNGELYLFVKGASDKIVNQCSYIMNKDNVNAMNSIEKREISIQTEELAQNALRVLAFAYKKLDTMPIVVDKSLERDLTFVGLQGMIDPPRKEAIIAVANCYKANIKPVMITGDHKITATAIAKELGMEINSENILTGQDVEAMTDVELMNIVHKISVFARVTPNHKLRIVQAYKKTNNIVAMTGDGVNDAPALKEADIGIAMGQKGTDVAKEASDMVLLDDNFATIVEAISEGRMIYDNIRKFIRYLLSSNLGEILLMGAAAFLGMPLPLIPIQILWINLVTDGLPALALGMDPPDHDIMDRPPRKNSEGIFSGGLAGNIAFSGLLIGASALLAFAVSNYLSNGNEMLSRTVSFVTMIMAELIFAFECRSEYKSVFKINIFENTKLLLACLISFALMLSVVYIPFLSTIFKTVPLGLKDWAIVGAFGSIEFILNSIVFAPIKAKKYLVKAKA